MHNTERWPFVLCGILCLQMSYVLADLDKRCSSSTYERGTDPQGVCGSELSNVVSVICGGLTNINILNGKRDTHDYHYSHHWYRKRNTEKTDDKTPESNTKAKLQHILLRRQDATSYLSKRGNYFETGIVCECCYHSCSYDELQQYCRSLPTDIPRFGMKRKRSVPGQKTVEA